MQIAITNYELEQLLNALGVCIGSISPRAFPDVYKEYMDLFAKLKALKEESK